MWNDLNEIWKEAFSLAWESYRRNSIPIGAVIVDSQGNIVSRGRNRIFDGESQNPLAGTDMAHAEMTAMLNLKLDEHPEVRSYCMYTTMEPCPMCFGTMVMNSIRNIKFADRDGYAGATELNEKSRYIKNKGISITKADDEMETFQIVLQTAFEYKRNNSGSEVVLDKWREYCNIGVNLGKQLNEEGYFENAAAQGKNISVIYDEVISYIGHRD
ncbi:nucleoside deaminase [Clostridium thermarum]|uniref:nucleoside deaminase n=1 Tax=Clostridium thermarum TaxID=1716543 RepID=UPI001120BACA|nr:nucleoside deaminase [Clostridium thermarum]